MTNAILLALTLTLTNNVSITGDVEWRGPDAIVVTHSKGIWHLKENQLTRESFMELLASKKKGCYETEGAAAITIPREGERLVDVFVFRESSPGMFVTIKHLSDDSYDELARYGYDKLQRHEAERDSFKVEYINAKQVVKNGMLGPTKVWRYFFRITGDRPAAGDRASVGIWLYSKGGGQGGSGVIRFDNTPEVAATGWIDSYVAPINENVYGNLSFDWTAFADEKKTANGNGSIKE